MDAATSARECTRLLGSINAGLAHVTDVGNKAAEQGRNAFSETATALDSVGRAIEAQTYFTPDLLRLGGFFIGIVRNQSRILGEIALTQDGDAQRLAGLQQQLGQLYEQEDGVLAQLESICRASKPAAVPSSSAAPPSTAASSPPVGPSTSALPLPP